MRSRPEHARALVLAVWFAGAGCYASNGRLDAGDASHGDGDILEAGFQRDADADGSAFIGDAGMCEAFGSTRLCTADCSLACPTGTVCNDFMGFCDHVDDRCHIDLEFGNPYICREGRTCVATELFRSSEADWMGRCVDPEYCRWLLANPDARPDQHCRYSEGTLFVNGPPDHECAPGAYELAPFCGGACGDTCPDYPSGNVGCVGISETRGFGVCVPDGYERCHPASTVQEAITSCAWELIRMGASTDVQCACMVLSPTAAPAEYAENGWAVSRQSCLAYRERYPDEVRCFDSQWGEL